MPEFKKADPKKYPGRPKVKGEHYVRLHWSGPGPYETELQDGTEVFVIQGQTRSFPEGMLDELIEEGFTWEGWAAA